MKVGYGLITCQKPASDKRTDTEIYAEALQLAKACEDNSLASVWLSEHHFVDDGYMPSLAVVCAAIAARTTRIEIGTGIILAPLYDPIRLAEDAATVDLISGGRFTLGIGAGWRDEEFTGLGRTTKQRVSAMSDTVAILRQAWADKLVNYQGKWRSVENVFVTPKPAHAITILMGGFVDEAIKRSGRIADGFIGSSSGTSGIDGFKRAKDLALEGVAAANRDPSTFKFYLHVPVFVGAWEEVREHYHYIRWKYADMGGKLASTTPAPLPTLSDAEEAGLRETIICGSASQVADEIGRFKDALGDDVHFICRSYFPGMAFARQLELVEQLGRDVVPALH